MGIWEFKNLFFVIVAVTLLSTGFTGMSGFAFADKEEKDEKNNDNTTPIINLGYLQLAAHDFFNMQRCMDLDRVLIPGCIPEDLEDGKLNLSTVLFDPKSGDCDFEKSYKKIDGCELRDEADIALGGEFRSRENIMIFTAGVEVGEKYLKIADKHGEEKAYKKVLKFYHKQLKKAYEQSFHLKFPKPQEGETTNMHNLAMRAGHDFLPEDIIFEGKLTSLFSNELDGKTLSKKEKKQPSSPMDGKFDEGFLNIVVFCPSPTDPSFCITVNLLAADQDFGIEFGLGAGTFDEFMKQLSDGKLEKNEDLAKLLKEAFEFGLYFN